MLAKKLLLNVFYTIVLMVLFLTIVWAYKHGDIIILAASVLFFALFIYLKVVLAKSVREMQRKR